MWTSARLIASVAALLLTAQAAPATAPASTESALSGSPRYLFTFGDSYTTTQFDPKGVQPTADNPLGNWGPPKEGWVYYVSSVYNSSLTLSYNYARGGATINQTIIPGRNTSFQQQAEGWFLPLAGKRPASAQWSSTDGIAGMFFGINDVENSFTMDESRFAPEIEVLQASYMRIVNELYATGLRNFFWFNLPPLQYSKAVRDMGADAMQHWADYSTAYNVALEKSVADFAASHAGVTTHVFDNNAVWRQVLANPNGYGFMDNTTIGYYYDSTVVWGDGFHPSGAMQHILARNLASELHTTFGF